MKEYLNEILYGARFVLHVALIFMFSCAKAGEVDASNDEKKSGSVILGLIGYNYTDRTIASYQVNGAGGGDISLSSPTSGGSGTTCCVQYEKARKIPVRAVVRWQEGGCFYHVKSQASNYISRQTRYYYKEKEVQVDLMHNGNPGYVETHFYPSGDIKVAITDEISLPRVKLDGRRPEKSNFERCKNGQKSED